MRIEKKVEKTVTVTDYVVVRLCDRCGKECGDDRRAMSLSYDRYEYDYEYHRQCRDMVLADIGLKDWPLVQERTVLDEKGEDIRRTNLCGMCGGEIDKVTGVFFPFVPGRSVRMCKECAKSIMPMLRDESKLPKEVE